MTSTPGTAPRLPALDWGCGMTVDLFWSTGDGSVSIQWLWGAPAVRLASEGLDESGVLDQVSTVITRLGFCPIESKTNHLVLPNGYSRDSACPFAASGCAGEHLVISGAGLIAEERIREFADRIGVFSLRAPTTAGMPGGAIRTAPQVAADGRS